MTAEETKSPPSPTDLAVEQASRFAEAADKIRSRSETAAKGLAALGTTAVGAVGIAKFADVFPIPSGYGGLLFAVIGGFILMTAAVVLFSARLWRVSRPVYMRSDLDAVLKDLDNEDEKKAVSAAYTEIARKNDASCLRSYEARGWRLQRIALRQNSPAKRNELLEHSTLILADVRTTQLRAAIIVIRKRASSVASGWGTWVIVGLFVLGLIGVGVGTDWLDSARTKESQQIATAKACADAMATITKQNLDPTVLLPASCRTNTTPPPTSTTGTPTDQLDQVMNMIASQYRSCVDELIKQGRSDTSECAPQLQIVVQAGS